MAIFTSFWLYDLIVVAIAAFAALYASFSIKFQYWRKRNVPVPEVPSFPFGNFSGVSRTNSMMMIAAKLYEAAKNERFFGVYLFTKPVIIVRDLELVKNILVKDFGSFHDRGFTADLKREPLAVIRFPKTEVLLAQEPATADLRYFIKAESFSVHAPYTGQLFLMNGQEWRNLRIKLIPTFTSGKMKMMFPTLIDVGKELEEHFKLCAKNEEETEVKDILARYTTDVISSCAFGIETNSLKNPDAAFRKMGVEMTHPKLQQVIAHLLLFAFPKSLKYIPVQIIPKHITNFFINAVRDTMNYRMDNNVQRNDFLQLLMQLKNFGYIPDADNPVKKDDGGDAIQQKFTLEQATAQAFLFFFAGFETSSSAMQFALYELALSPELQTNVQQEIDAIKTKHNGQVTYEGLQEMDLLDRIVAETLRKYPVAAAHIRECNADYSIPDSQVVIEKGTSIWLSAYGIHHDPEHYPDPERFDPDRFLPEVKDKRNHYAYLPFGEGPRNCIGNRFALMQTKAGLAIVLSGFTLTPSKRTPIPMVFDATTDILSPKGEMYLKINSRSNN